MGDAARMLFNPDLGVADPLFLAYVGFMASAIIFRLFSPDQRRCLVNNMKATLKKNMEESRK